MVHGITAPASIYLVSSIVRSRAAFEPEINDDANVHGTSTHI